MALQFNGTQYLSRSSAILTAPPMTFSCWFNPGTLSVDQCQMSIGSSTLNDFFSIFCTTLFNQQRCETEHNSVGQSAIRNNILRIGQWFNITGVITSSISRQIYINGVAGTISTTNSIPVGLDTTSIGALFKVGPINLARSKIAFPSIWNIALSPTDVANLYNSGVGADPRVIQNANLVSFSLLAGSPYLDSVAGTNWSVTGTPTVVADPFTLTGTGGVAIAPTVTVQAADAISATIATFHGNITDTGGANAALVGFDYGPTIAYGTTVSTSGSFSTGPFSYMITGLPPSTDLHYRAFATNLAGTGRSGDSPFTTQSSGGGPPITYIQSNIATTASATSSFSCAYSGTQTAGNANVVFVYASVPGLGKYANTLTDSSLNMYQNIGYAADTSQRQCSIWVAGNIAASASNTVTADLPNFANVTLVVVEYSGVSTTFPVSNWTFNSASSASATLPITTPNPFEMVVTLVHENAVTTMTPSGGLTTRLTSGAIQVMDGRYIDAGAQVPATTVANGLWLMVGVALNPSGAVNPAAGPFTKGEVLFNGTQLGTVGHDANSTTKANLIDSDEFTVWNVDQVGCWAGIDCGVPTKLTRVRITAKGGHEDASMGCMIHGSNDPTFVSGNLLYLVPNVRPTSGTLLNEYPISFPSAITYQYYRFHSVNKTLFLADLDFIGNYTDGVAAMAITPVINPPGGHFYSPMVVRISTLTTDATLYYTLDGTTPTSSSNWCTGQIIIDHKCQLNVVAISPSLGTSRTATAYYYINPEINSGVFRFDDRNFRLTSRSGTIFRDPVSGFWFNYMENLDAFGYRTNGYQGFNVYRSADFMNWTYEGCICGPDPGTALNNLHYLFRPTVFYNASTQLYVLWATPSNGSTGMCVFTSEFADATEPWTLVTAFTATLGGNVGPFGDLGGFVDDNGTDAYIIFNYNNNSRVCYAQLNSDYLDINTGNMATYVSNGEAWTEFKRGSVYFVFLSGQTGINLNANTYQTASTPIGPWTPAAATPFQPVTGVGGVAPSNSYYSQVDNVIHLAGRGDCYIYGGDRLTMNTFGTVSEGLDSKVFLPMIFSSSTVFSITYGQGTWFDGTFSSPFLLDAVYPPVSGFPLAPTNLSVQGGMATWSNNEQMAVNLYLEGANDINFTSTPIADIVPMGANSLMVTQPRNFYRIRAVNANGASFSNSFFLGAGGGLGSVSAQSPSGRHFSLDATTNLFISIIGDNHADILFDISAPVPQPPFMNTGISGDTRIPNMFENEYDKYYKLIEKPYRV